MNDMLPPKFIIENIEELGKCLIIQRAKYHKQIANNKENVIGGGYWKRDGNTFIFSGSSEDFGKATEEDISECIKNGNVFSNKSCIFSIVDKFNFKYDIGSELIDI